MTAPAQRRHHPPPSPSFTWARANHEAQQPFRAELKRLGEAVHELNAWAEHETADVADQRALLNQLSCRLGALAAAVAELPQVFSESVAGLVDGGARVNAVARFK